MARASSPSLTREASRQRGRVVGTLRPFFDPAIAERGASYFRRGVVEVIQWTERGIHAQVRGSAPYTTGLCCDSEGNLQVVYLWCDCPFVVRSEEPCKHLWAVIQMADALGALGALGNRLQRLHLAQDPREVVDDAQAASGSSPMPSWNADRAISDGMPITGAASLLTGALRSDGYSVPRSVGPTGSQVQWEGRPTELLCSLDAELVRGSGQLELTGWMRPRGGSYERFNRRSAELAELGETDRWLSRHLRRSRTDVRCSFHDAALDTRRLFLRLCRDHRLVYWPEGEMSAPNHALPLTFDRGAAWRLRLVGEPRDGDLLVRGELFRFRGRKCEGRPLEEPEFVSRAGIVGWSERIAKLNVDDETWKWIAELRSSSPAEIAAEEVESFLDKHLEPRSGPELVLPDDLGFVRGTVEPRPCLLLRVVERAPVISGHVELEYGNRSVAIPHRPAIVVELSERRIHAHEPAAERRFAEELLAAGFEGFVLRTLIGELPDYAPSRTENVNIATTHAPAAISQLLKAGWRVMANGKPYRSMSRFKARIHSGQDWFEVEGGAEFDGQRLGMPELLRAARRGEGAVALGDGSVGLLPETWLARLGLLGSDPTSPDKVRVPRSQLLLLDEFARVEGLGVDAAFGRLREELRDFRELTPAKAPPGFRGELRDYQRQGLAWMLLLGRLGFGGCLADDMGLGKTIQVLALLLGRNRHKRRLPPSLVVAPSSVVFNWAAEAERFAPTLRVVAHTGAARHPLEETLAHADVVVTSYTLLRREAEAFIAASFDYVILDEAQAIKNYETETAKVARALNASTRLTMTGTPIENHLGELASQLEFLNPGILGSSPPLARALFAGKAGTESLELVQRTIKPFLLRRTKREVARELPERIERNLFVELRGSERRRYDELLRHYRRRIDSQVAKVGLARSTPQVLEALLRLRQAACHPGLLDDGRRSDSSAKLDRVIEEIERIAELGERCLVFSQFTTFLGILRERLDARGIRYEYLDGHSRWRQRIVQHFQSPGGPPVFLISLMAGGVGLNLTAAEHVLLLDPWWNPAVEAQAIDRSHRIGQQRTVFAYKLIARGTVEEKVLALQSQKRALAQAILGEDAGLGGKLTREDLEAILG